MKTIILRIAEKAPGPPPFYRVEVIDVRWAAGGWSETVEGSHDVPADEFEGPAVAVAPPLAAPATAPVSGAVAQGVGPGKAGEGDRNLGPGKGAGGDGSRAARDAAALFNLVFQHGSLDAWNRLTGTAGKTGAVAKYRLILDIAPQILRRRRWERMGKDPVYPGCEPNCSLVRGPVDLTYLAPMLDGPIKVLLVVGSGASEEAEVHAEDEVRELEAVFKDLTQGLEYKILRRPTRETLPAAIVALQPDVFHFIGHGRLFNGAPQLFLHHDLDPPKNLPWELADIVKDFRGVSPSFVFLNACHTVAEVEAADAWSMSDLFVGRLGARAVLGMHAAVRGTTAGKLAAALYRALADGKSLDLALTEARCTADILKFDDPSRRYDWALPYLRLTVLPDLVLPLAPAVPEDIGAKFRNVTEFKDNAYFVDRVEPRQRFTGHIQPKSRCNLILIAGEKGIGKTHLIRNCLEAVAQKGRLLKYVELDKDKAYNVLDILELLCTGDDWSPIGAPLPVPALEPFARVHNALLRGENADDPEVLSRSPTTLTWKPVPTEGRTKTEDPVKSLLGAFLRSLRGVAVEARKARARELEEQGYPQDAERARRDQRRFLLVLDQVSLNPGRPRRDELVSKAFKEALVPHLIRPLARGVVKDLTLALAVAPDDLQAFGLDERTLGLTPDSVPVPRLNANLFLDLADEFFTKCGAFEALNRLNKSADLHNFLVNTSQYYLSVNMEWSPSDFKHFYDLLVSRFAGPLQ